MEEDEEIHSSPSSPLSPPPPPSNSSITVTVAAAPPPNSPHPENALVLALPPPHKEKNNGGGREDCWSEEATGVLIDAWGERYLELSRGNLKQKHWKEVADIVSSREDYMKTPKTDIQCKNRIDTVKKKYKSEKAKVSIGGGASKWVFFEKLDELIGQSAKIPANAAASSGGSGGSADFLSKIPMGIPVGIRSSLNPYRISQVQQQQQQQQQKQGRMVVLNNQMKQGKMVVLNNQMKQGPVDMDSDEDADSFDSLPPPPRVGKRARRVLHKGGNSGEKRRKCGSSFRELTQAIVRFGQAYEQTESAKLQQVVEMEKQRMKFTKELELQRMQFFMKTQLEILQSKQGKRVAAGMCNSGDQKRVAAGMCNSGDQKRVATGICNSGDHHNKVSNSNNNHNNAIDNNNNNNSYSSN